MTGQRLRADVEGYSLARTQDLAPSAIVSDPLVDGASPIEQMLRVLGLASNSGDSQDYADSAEEHARRQAITGDAADGFAAQDDGAAAQFAQQLPGMAAGVAAAVAGALGAALQSVGALPQQAMQAGVGLAGHLDGGSPTAEPPAMDADTDIAEFDEPVMPAIAGLGAGLGSGAAGPVPGGTSPAALPGPPAVPSAATSPASAAPGRAPAVAAGLPAPAPSAGMAGIPFIPPGSGRATAGSDAKPDTRSDTSADTKRVSVAPVRNGAPVQGRITVPAG